MGTAVGDQVRRAALASEKREVLASNPDRHRPTRGEVLRPAHRLPEETEIPRGERPRPRVDEVDPVIFTQLQAPRLDQRRVVAASRLTAWWAGAWARPARPFPAAPPGAGACPPGPRSARRAGRGPWRPAAGGTSPRSPASARRLHCVPA